MVDNQNLEWVNLELALGKFVTERDQRTIQAKLDVIKRREEPLPFAHEGGHYSIPFGCTVNSIEFINWVSNEGYGISDLVFKLFGDDERLTAVPPPAKEQPDIKTDDEATTVEVATAEPFEPKGRNAYQRALSCFIAAMDELNITAEEVLDSSNKRAKQVDLKNKVRTHKYCATLTRDAFNNHWKTARSTCFR